MQNDKFLAAARWNQVRKPVNKDQAWDSILSNKSEKHRPFDEVLGAARCLFRTRARSRFEDRTSSQTVTEGEGEAEEGEEQLPCPNSDELIARYGAIGSGDLAAPTCASLTTLEA